MADQPLPSETLACMLTDAGMGYYCEYTGPRSATELDASGITPPRGASDEQSRAWEAGEDKSLAAFIRTFQPQGAPAPDADPRDIISFMSHELIDIAPFAPYFRPQRIPMYAPGPGETLARVQAIALCFSDCKVIHQGSSHVRLFNRDLSAEPNVPGHEACLEVAQLGEGTEQKHGIHVGDRYAIQADIYVDGVSHAFGYFHRGAMQQFTCLAEEVLANDRGNCLLPVEASRYPDKTCVKADLGRAEAAVAEPWGCVAARIEYRTTIKPGGTVWAIGATDEHLDELRAIAAVAGRMILTGGDAGALAPALGAEVADDVAAAVEAHPKGIDDVLVLEGDPATVELAADAMADGAFMLVPAFDPDSDAQLDVGGIHYKGLSFIGHTEPTIAGSYAKARRTRLKGGGRVLFVGAGGPMGQIFVQTAIGSPEPPAWMLITEIDDRRLELLERLFRPQAEAKGIEIHFANPMQTDLATLVDPQSLDDVVGLCPVWMPMKQCEPFLAQDGVINIFAGIKAGTKGPVDLSILSRGATIIGNSGSSVEDLTGVLTGALEGTVQPNKSVAAIGSLAKAWEAMRRVMYRETSGKICLFPELDLPELIELDQLVEHFPTVAEKLDAHGLWTREAEDELFRVCPRVQL
jgi:threonine dehydrogenase-like Zn-dependent dehydrogenase